MPFLLKEKLCNFIVMKKPFRIKRSLFKLEMTYTVSEELNKLKGKVFAPKKLAEANEMLSRLKTPLPK